MKSNSDIFWSYLKTYFSVYLPKQRNSSPHTITACRDTWNLLLRYLFQEKGISGSKITMDDITSVAVMGFLDYMSESRGWMPSTRNHRLSCIRSFFDYVACQEPALYVYAAGLKSIPSQKKGKKDIIEYMSREAMKTLLGIPDPETRNGLRDQFFMSLMYDTAARDCEMLAMRLSDYNESSLTVYLMGKGAKPRLVPVSAETTGLFTRYRQRMHPENAGGESMFYTIHKHMKTEMSDDNVARFIKKYADAARKENPDIPDRVHPHMFRKSRAMHLYQAGMNLSVLSEFLGHEDPQTTLIYARADVEMKRDAICKATENSMAIHPDTEKPIWEDNADIITRLCRGY